VGGWYFDKEIGQREGVFSEGEKEFAAVNGKSSGSAE